MPKLYIRDTSEDPDAWAIRVAAPDEIAAEYRLLFEVASPPSSNRQLLQPQGRRRERTRSMATERESRVGDVFRWTLFTDKPLAEMRYCEEDLAASEYARAEKQHPDRYQFAFNLPDLLAGDPIAWAEALRFAPECVRAGVTRGMMVQWLVFAVQCACQVVDESEDDNERATLREAIEHMETARRSIEVTVPDHLALNWAEYMAVAEKDPTAVRAALESEGSDEDRDAAAGEAG